MEAIILAGGKSSRMGNDLPKPLTLINGKPLISYQIEYLVKSKQINKIFFALGHWSDMVVDSIDENYYFNIWFVYDISVETEPLGTAGALKLALGKTTDENILVLNCDDMVDIDIAKISKFKENTICVAHPKISFGIVNEVHGYATFEEKPVLDIWASCGWYIFNKTKLLPFLPDRGSLEYDVLPNLKLKLRIYKHNGFWKPINTKKDIEEIEADGLPTVFK